MTIVLKYTPEEKEALRASWLAHIDQDADRAFGLHSLIPLCCIEAYLLGRFSYDVDERLAGLRPPATIHQCVRGRPDCDKYIRMMHSVRGSVTRGT